MLAKIFNSNIGDTFGLTVIYITDRKNILQDVFTLTHKNVLSLNKPEKDIEMTLIGKRSNRVIGIAITLQQGKVYYNAGIVMKETGFPSVDIFETANADEMLHLDVQIAENYDTYQTKSRVISKKIQKLREEIKKLEDENCLEKLKAEENRYKLINQRNELFKKLYTSGTFNIL
jgi:hypothetical protein